MKFIELMNKEPYILVAVIGLFIMLVVSLVESYAHSIGLGTFVTGFYICGAGVILYNRKAFSQLKREEEAQEESNSIRTSVQTRNNLQ